MKINIVITVTVAFSLCQGRHVGVYIGREGDAERAWPHMCSVLVPRCMVLSAGVVLVRFVLCVSCWLVPVWLS